MLMLLEFLRINTLVTTSEISSMHRWYVHVQNSRMYRKDACKRIIVLCIAKATAEIGEFVE